MRRGPSRCLVAGTETGPWSRCHHEGVTAVAAARAGIVAGGALVGFLSASRAYDVDQPWLWGSDLGVTGAFAVVAAMALSSSWRVAALAASVSAAWALASWWPFAVYWHRGILVHLLVLLTVSAVSWWPRRGAAAGVIVLMYVVSVTPFVWQWHAAALTLGLGLIAAPLVLRPRPLGRAAVQGMGALILLGTVLAAAGSLAFIAAIPAALEVRAVGYALGLVGVAVLCALATRPTSIGRATDAVVELGAEPDDAVRDILAVALHDRSLEIGGWSPDIGRFLSSRGQEVAKPAEGGRRRGLIVEVDGRPLAMVVGAAARLDDVGVEEAILRASGLATEHAKLSTRIREATLDVARSQRRFIDSAACERVALARELDREVAQPLRALAAELDRVPSTNRLRAAEELVGRALGELDAIAQGLHPARLDGGLAAALADLVHRLPVPVHLQVDDLDDEVAAQAAYYVCAEAVANAVRHAECAAVAITVANRAGHLEVSIADDGKGGAVARPGSGLRGLEHRVAGVGGTLHVSSRGGGGTIVCARLPVSAERSLVEASR